MANYPPLYNSPADFAMHGSKFVGIPMPQPVPGAGTNLPPTQHPPPCPSPGPQSQACGRLLVEHVVDFSPEMRRRKANGGTWRIFFTIATFCIGCLVIYFTLAHVYGTEVIPPPITPDANTSYKRFPRSDPLPVSMTEILDDFKTKQYSFKIIVFAWRRLASLQRLMNSLLTAEYFGYPVVIEFHLDAGADEAVLDYLKNEVEWPFGRAGIVQQTQPQGLASLVTSAWSPEGDSEFAFLFEDDIEASSFFFEFACRAIYESVGVNEKVIGVALNTPRYDEINLLTSIWLPEWEIGQDARVFLFQLPSSWGVLYFPWSWREFLQFYRQRAASPAPSTIVPAARINIWQRSWKRFLAELMYLKGQVLVYASLPNQASFAVNHREVGEHTHETAQAPQLKDLNAHENDYYVTPKITESPLQVFHQIHSNATLPVVALHHDSVSSLNELDLRRELLSHLKHD